MRFKEYISEMEDKHSNADNPDWAAKTYHFWSEQKKKHPKDKKTDWNYQQSKKIYKQHNKEV
jgi:hypothetical protein